MRKKIGILIVTVLLLVGCGELIKLYNSIKDGASCTDSGGSTCLGGTCLAESDGFPGGMCTTVDCANHACASLTAECFRTTIGGVEKAVCLETCKGGRSCARTSEGYSCQIVDDSQVCVPGNAVATEPRGVIGATCTVDVECNGADRVCLSDFPSGYCSQEKCTVGSSDSCLGGNTCVSTKPGDASAKTLCLKKCSGDGDCRFKYSCQTYNGVSGVCMPSTDSPVKNPDGADDGAACVSNLNCKGGTCIREDDGKESNGNQSGEKSYPGGYCITRDCTSDAQCNGSSSVCVQRGRSTACFQKCNDDSNCRSGYRCIDSTQGKICDSIKQPPQTTVPSDGATDITCLSPFDGTISFTVPSGAVGFYIAPFAKANYRVTPTELKNNTEMIRIDIENNYSFMAVNPRLLGTLAPILFPATDVPQFKSAAWGGNYEMKVTTSSPELCYTLIPKMSEGTNLSVKIHLVGIPGIDSGSAGSNSDIAEMVQAMRSIYRDMGVEIKDVSYVDVSSAVRDQYRVIRNFNDIFSLVATTEQSGSSVSANLVVNVFLIQGFAISESPGLLGVSTGIPGVAGLNGTIGSGLVFTGSMLGRANGQLGQTMAHEIGHFIGLRHTTEHDGAAHDPITDTPTCSNPKLQYACPDATNFMFAFAMGTDQTQTTPGQAFVVKRSPLVK